MVTLVKKGIYEILKSLKRRHEETFRVFGDGVRIRDGFTLRIVRIRKYALMLELVSSPVQLFRGATWT
jgi:hypothetical protein